MVFLGAAALLAACATGSDESGATMSGPKGAVGADESSSDDGSMPWPPGTGTSSADGGESEAGSSGGVPGDGGSPACCLPQQSPGCGSAATEACVCTHTPACCQDTWTEECVELAYQCGDPFCQGAATGGEVPTDDSGDSGSEGGEGDPEPPPPPPPPPPECPCLDMVPGVTEEIDNFCFYGPNYPGCPMTEPGGYCDPDGDGNFYDEHGDWVQGYYDYLDQCG